MKDFQEFYNVYLSKHQNKWTRRIHMLGNLFTLAWIFYFTYMGFADHWTMFLWLILSPLVVYPFAWLSHWIIEGNKPAAFKNPIKSKMADWKMMWEVFTGKIPF